MDIDFNGRPILITGATGGIGGATVRRLIERGANVIVAGRDESALATLARETGCRARAFGLETEESVSAALSDLDLWGAVNCAGFGGEIATPMETHLDVFDKLIAINTRGALLVTKYASRSMVRLGKGGHRQCVKPSGSGGALGAYLLRRVQGGAR
jgi:NAD(P)-dependent dehydrogenase (short-subunit alcohol dehydrogenase family)